ncbi:MAG: hypothetical protein Fur0025_42080 [Oscillatoriaceae cyanobacterium]
MGTFFWAVAQLLSQDTDLTQLQTYGPDLLRYVNGSADVGKYYSGVEAKGI